MMFAKVFCLLALGFFSVANLAEAGEFDDKNGPFPRGEYPYAHYPDGCSDATEPGGADWTRDTWGPVSFVDACNAHDRCYYTVGTKWQDCSYNFQKDLRAACERGFTKTVKIGPFKEDVIWDYASLNTCYGLVVAYTTGVSVTNVSGLPWPNYFEEAQAEQKKYLEWYEGRRAAAVAKANAAAAHASLPPQASEPYSPSRLANGFLVRFANVDSSETPIPDLILVQANYIEVRLSGINRFFPPTTHNGILSEGWADGFQAGNVGVYFADVNGDNLDDLINVNTHHIEVRFSRNIRFMPPTSHNGDLSEGWVDGFTAGEIGTFFADVNGDKKADLIIVDLNKITVRLSSGNRFMPPTVHNGNLDEGWADGFRAGKHGVYFADVGGDGLADLINITEDRVEVRMSSGNRFLPPHTHNNILEEGWVDGLRPGKYGMYFADVGGDGLADFINVMEDRIEVRMSSGNRFMPPHTHNNILEEGWADGFDPASVVGFADVNGDKMADLIAKRDPGLMVRLSSGNRFMPPHTHNGDPDEGWVRFDK